MSTAVTGCDRHPSATNKDGCSENINNTLKRVQCPSWSKSHTVEKGQINTQTQHSHSSKEYRRTHTEHELGAGLRLTACLALLITQDAFIFWLVCFSKILYGAKAGLELTVPQASLQLTTLRVLPPKAGDSPEPSCLVVYSADLLRISFPYSSFQKCCTESILSPPVPGSTCLPHLQLSLPCFMPVGDTLLG